MPRPDLVALARIVADWIDAAPGAQAAYLFGSCVRGDHRPDSDIDIRLFVHEWEGDDTTTDWWTEQNGTHFTALEAMLPGPIHVIFNRDDPSDATIQEGAKNPLYVDRKAVCVRTPPRVKR